MDRVYYSHTKWEEVKYNMYGNYKLDNKEKLIKKVIDYFNNPELINKWMYFVITNFKHSCEHNFTNPNMNKIAWLGQSSVSAYFKIPNEITMIAWNYLDKKTQNRANKIALKYIKEWEFNHNYQQKLDRWLYA